MRRWQGRHPSQGRDTLAGLGFTPGVTGIAKEGSTPSLPANVCITRVLTNKRLTILFINNQKRRDKNPP